jgi:hypothetical protein
MPFIHTLSPKNKTIVVRQEIEQQMDELAPEYYETHDLEILE